VRNIKVAIITVAVAAIGSAYYFYDRHATRYPGTDDAYIRADVMHVAPQVSGPVAKVFVRNQQQVHAGDPLFTIERQPFKLALEKAQAHLATVEHDVAQKEAAVASAEAELKRAKVLQTNAKRKSHRTATLQKTHFLPQESADDAEADYLAAQAAYSVAQAKLLEARRGLGTPGDQNEAVREARAAVGEAQWDLDHTQINAGCDGNISELTLQQSDAARTGIADFVLICNNNFWIEANFKETDLARIRPGQPTELHVDMYPDYTFKGEVESINGASGVAFSLLPPQNASGNWVKVTQRVPVRIKVLNPDSKHPLLVGTSADVSIDTGPL
jgi:membrane fusion protein (multidrug efflux system)